MRHPFVERFILVFFANLTAMAMVIVAGLRPEAPPPRLLALTMAALLLTVAMLIASRPKEPRCD